jgi:hypothetical protein
MFTYFHAMSINSDHIELVYFWPRPAALLQRTDLLNVRLVHGRRYCGHMEVSTKEVVYRSVDFRTCGLAEQILAKLSLH